MKAVLKSFGGFRTLFGRYVLLFFLMVFTSLSAQTIIDQQPFSGSSIPQGWTGNSIVVSGGYAKFASVGAALTSPAYNLSLYNSVNLSFELANETADDGGPLTVSVSSNGGATYTAQTFSTAQPTGVFFFSVSNAISSFSSDVRINFSRQGGVGPLKFRQFKLEGVLQPRLLLNGSLFEDTLHGATFIAELTVGTFAPTLNKNFFTLLNAPSGISITSVTRNSDTQAKVVLAYNGTDFDNNVNVGLSLSANQTAQNLSVNSFNTMPLLAHVETITVTPPVRNNLNYFSGAGPSVSKSYTITGTNFSPGSGNLVIYGNSYYEVSLSPDSNFGGNVVLAYDVNGNLAGNTFYARLKSGLAAGTYNTASLLLMGGKATTQVVANGKVIGGTITNDLCANAETVDSYVGVINGTLASSSYTAISQGDGYKDVWYRFVAACSGNYTVSLSDFSGNADLFLYQGACPTAASQVVASSQTTNAQELIEYFVPEAGTYYIRVAAVNTAAEAPFHLSFYRNLEAPIIQVGGTVTAVTTATATIEATPQISCGSNFYGVEYSTIQGFAPGTGVSAIAPSISSGAYTLVLDGLDADTTYYFRVWELNTFATGYGPEQSFVTAQELIGTESIFVPVAQSAANVTMTGLRTRWFMPGQYNFKLNISTSPSFDTYLLNETFAGFTGNGLIPVTSPDAHFQQTGWTVSNVFEGSDVAVVGAAGQSGSLTSPALDLSSLTGETYISVDLSKYQTDNTTVQVLFSADGSSWTQLGTDLAVLADSHTFAFAVTGGTATSKIKIQTSPSSPGKRFKLDNVTITNYQGTTQSLSYATVSSGATTANVGGVDGRIFFRQVSSLSGGTTYYYRVRAESNGMYSAPSAPIAISTLAMNIQNGILYVRKDQGGTGESWASPMSELADALNLAKQLNDSSAGTIRQIWVASGKYRPMYRADNYSNADPNDRDNAFVLLNGVSLYGGFAGFESSVNNRQYLPLSTGSAGGEALLTGKIGVEEIETDNVYHVMVASGLTASSGTVVDGFIIRDSYTNGTGEITCNGNTIKRYDGGGVYNKNSEYELRNSLIEQNYVTGNGGGVYNENCASGMIINASQISNNTATSGAGVANIYGAPVVKATLVKNNTATANGGGVYNESSAATVRDLSIVTQNTAISGGGAYNVYSSANMYNATVSSNSASYGAGIYNATSNTLFYDRVNIKSNHATHLGGAIYTEGDSNITASGADSFTNCIIASNTADEKGGALYYQAGNSPLFSGLNAGPIFTNVTFDANAAQGEGALVYYDNAGAAQTPAVIKNSIVMNNGGATFVDTSSSGGIDAVVFVNSLTDAQSLGSNFNSGNNILASDPLFGNASIGDYTLDTNSPAVNVGLTDYYNAGLVPDLFNVTKDYAGNERVFDGFIDLGAYEWQDVLPCTITTVWNGSVWSNGEPQSIEYAAVFEGDFESDGNLTACSVTVNSGVVTVKTGNTLRVKGAVVVEDLAQLTIENNAALLQVNNVANTGKIVFQKSGNQLYRLDYTMWSSPVAEQNIQAFSPATASNRYYEYKYDYNGSEWVEAYWTINGATTDFSAGKGYLIRMPNDYSTVDGYMDGETAVQYEGVFVGKPNNGNLNVNLSVSGGRYTAVGNPYPSPISVYDFFATNSNVIDISSGIYFWRKKNNYASSSYATLTMAAYVANPALGGGAGQAQFFSGSSSSWTISPGQGFLVRTKTGVATPVLRFTNKMRRGTPGTSQAFLRQQQNAEPITPVSRYWINVEGTETAASQMAVAYMSEATNGFDYGYDAKSLSDGSFVSLYSLQGDTALAIQAKADFIDSDVVPLGFVADAAGSYTISLDRSEGVFAQGQQIYLKDNQLGIVTRLSERDYIFTSEQGVFNGRFEILYNTETLTVKNPTLQNAEVVVYKKGNGIVADAGTHTIKALEIYDIRGRRVYAASGINATSYTVETLHAEHEMLIVNITTDAGTSTKKIIF